ncbi:MAG: cation diffusion facilitator family transporter [Jatrophihabitantaceae bacterium]
MHGHDHRRGTSAGRADGRWLTAALGVIVTFMVGEIIAGLLAHSLALITDAAHMLSDAGALAVAIIAAGIARRPARGPYTYGFARVDALSGQASGITLLLLAIWFAVEAVLRLMHPSGVHGLTVVVVAAIGIVVNLVATALAGRADRSSLNVRGVLAHLVTDVWAFGATLAAGVVVLASGWDRADPVASLTVAAVMAWTGWRLVQAAGRVFLEAAPSDVDPHALGQELATADGVAEVHDLHVWEIGPGAVALSAHVLVRPSHDCHEVASSLRAGLRERYGIGHVTLQTDHADAPEHAAQDCADAHGEIHTAPAG